MLQGASYAVGNAAYHSSNINEALLPIVPTLVKLLADPIARTRSHAVCMYIYTKSIVTCQQYNYLILLGHVLLFLLEPPFLCHKLLHLLDHALVDKHITVLCFFLSHLFKSFIGLRLMNLLICIPPQGILSEWKQVCISGNSGLNLHGRDVFNRLNELIWLRHVVAFHVTGNMFTMFQVH